VRSKARLASRHAQESDPRQNRRIAVVLLCLAAFAAACAGPGGSSIPGYVDGVPESPVAFARCMRVHGVPDFPDPSGGHFNLSGINQSSPQFMQAAGICGPSGPDAASSMQAQGLAKGLNYARCMRAHGIPNFPDPAASNGSISISVSSGSGVDPQSPVFQAAQQACLPALREAVSGNGDSGGAG
jgi:hypothetical protein